MAVSVRHILLTRFNVAVPFARDERRLDPAWLTERFALFESFCLPSVLGQTTKEFRWFVLFDAETPPEARGRAERLARGGAFIPLFAHGSWKEDLGGLLRERGAAGDGLLLTTRLDSDDALARGFMEGMLRSSGESPAVLSYPRGYVLDGGRLYSQDFPENPFLSMLEGSAACKTVLSESHEKIASVAPLRLLDGGPMWLQVVHSGNVSNRTRGVRVFGRGPEAAADFNLPPRAFAPAESPLGAAMDFLRSLRWWRHVRDPLLRRLRLR